MLRDAIGHLEPLSGLIIRWTTADTRPTMDTKSGCLVGVIWELSDYKSGACTRQKQAAHIRDYLKDDYPPWVTHFYLSISSLLRVC